MDYSRPFFILGNPRSGTTLFRLMLNCHPDLVVPPECGFIQWWYPKYGDWQASDCQSGNRLDNYLADLSTSRKIETWGLDFEQLKSRIRELRPSDYATLSALVYEVYGDGKEVRWGDKNNYYIHHVELLQKIYPQAQFLLIVRDGRDVACSYRNLPKGDPTLKYIPVLPQKIEEIAEEWVTNNRKVLDFFGDQTGTFLSVRYEDLLRKTVDVLQTVCSFLGVRYRKEMEDYYREVPGNKKEPEALMAWKEKTRQRPDQTNIGKYQQELSVEAIHLFERIAGPLLQEMGYAG